MYNKTIWVGFFKLLDVSLIMNPFHLDFDRMSDNQIKALWNPIQNLLYKQVIIH